MLLPSPARISLPGLCGGVFLSTNNGTSWTAVNSGLTNTDVHALAVSGTNLFAGTGLAASFVPPTTAQAGQQSIRLDKSSVWALAVSGTNLFAGTDGGVFLSTNNGTSWTEVNTGLTRHFCPCSCRLRHESLCRDFPQRLSLQKHGTSWTEVNSGLTDIDVISLVVYGTNLFAGIVDEPSVWWRPLSEMITWVEGSSKDLPTRFALSQNYPNPFNPRQKSVGKRR